jgi:hypothetical protein
MKKPHNLKPGKAIHHCTVYGIEHGIIATRIDDREVIIMAIANGYAMVRRPRCMPYVCMVDELSQ